MIATVILAFFVAIGIWVYSSFKHRQIHNNQNTHFHLPPGPWGLPIVGHLPFLGNYPEVTFLKWSKIYGPIFSVKFGSIPTVVLIDAKIIREAFKLDSFGGRPLLPNFVASSGRKGIAFTDGPFQTEQRNFIIQTFKQYGLTKSDLEFRARNEIVNFLQGLRSKLKLAIQFEKNTKERSGRFTIHHFFQFPLLNSIWMSVMGRHFSEDDPTLKDLTKLMDKYVDTNSSLLAQLSWFFPWIAHVLTVVGKNTAVNGLQTIYSYIGHQVDESRETHVPGEPKSITHAYFDQIALTDDANSSSHKGLEQRLTMGDVFLGAADTTSVSLDWLLLYMAREPLVQVKLQKEIDDILGLELNGSARPPTVLDRPKMPYTEAVIQELLRISSIAPLGLFHRTLNDVNFHNFRIPKGTMIVANLYGIHHDPDIWAEPDSFLPERFLNSAEAGSSNISKAAALTLPFSSGKRNCIGEGFARD